MRTPAEIATAFAPTEKISEAAPFYLVGIGGAGMSALALMLKRRGFTVRGSDSTWSPTIDQLENAGIAIDMGHANAVVDERDQLILSDAIMLDDSPEVAQARRLGIPFFRRSQLLGWLLRDKKVIAVTGTHGKTTTTAMIGAGLRAAGADPTIVVGAFVPDFGSSVIEGQSDLAVVEACEAYDSFHDLNPQIIVLTNLELDHVDFHKNWDRLRESVSRFVASLPSDGQLIYCTQDIGACEIAESFSGNKVRYSDAETADWDLAAPGAHNRLNAAGAIQAVIAAGADREKALRGVEAFRGAERRLQVLHDREITVVDDYAHHPTEIRASIAALREKYPNRRLVVVFQPHLYSRTADLIPEFAKALSGADLVVMTDIYPAREDPIPGISSARIVELTSVPCRYVPSRFLLSREVAHWTQPGDVVVGMGAGNIAEFAPAFIAEIDRPTWADAKAGRKLRIRVLCGGDSAEREVSLHSGQEVAAALVAKGHVAEIADMTQIIFQGFNRGEWIGPDRPDVVFLAVHGTNAEDGAIQGLLEMLHLPYTGSSLQSSAIAMDKALSKSLLERHGVRVPKGLLINSGAPVESILELLNSKGLADRAIVKPNAQGSTVGLSFVESSAEMEGALQKALVFGDTLVEEWIEGMEISVPVLGDRTLNPVEIAPASGKYDFESKYVPGATEEIVPARMSQAKLDEAMDLALRCHRALGCSGATRTDMIVSDEGQGEIVVLEVNTLPGMTATSLLPNSARSMGISMEDLCEWMALDALERYAQRP